MEALYIQGEMGGGVKLVYGAGLELMWVGVAKGKGGLIYPTIDLFYPDWSVDVILKIIEAMEDQKVYPRVYIGQCGKGVDVIILFLLEMQSISLVREILPGRVWESVGHKITDERRVGVVAAGEAEFSDDDISHFLDGFKGCGYFYVNIAKWKDQEAGSEVNLVKSIRLSSFEDKPPNLQELFS